MSRCKDCDALRIELGLRQNRINELEEYVKSYEKMWAKINVENWSLMNNMAIAQRKVREALTQLGG